MLKKEPSDSKKGESEIKYMTAKIENKINR